MIPELLVLAIEYDRAPLRYRDLVDHQAPLPACFDNLVSDLRGALAPDQAAVTAAALGTSEPALRARLMDFLRRVLFHPQANHYRILGLAESATADSINAHYHTLVGLFHPDRAAPGERSRHAADTARINQAYRCLRNPATRARYDRELAQAGFALSPTRRLRGEPWFRTDRRHPGKLARNRLVGATILLVATALVLVVATQRPTVRMGDATAPHPRETWAPNRGSAPPGPSAVAQAGPVPAPPQYIAPGSPMPLTGTAPRGLSRTPVEPFALAKGPEAVVEHFQNHVAAGDIQAMLLLLADDARISNRAITRGQQSGADFFEAALKRTLRLSGLRLEADGDGRFTASGSLQRLKGVNAGTGAGAEQVGEIRLELTEEDAGYRISALIYRIRP